MTENKKIRSIKEIEEQMLHYDRLLSYRDMTKKIGERTAEVKTKIGVCEELLKDILGEKK